MSTDSSHNGPMDFTPRPSAAFAAAFEQFIDAAMQAENAAQEPRNYIGASRLGEECLRKLGYEFHRAPKDEGREFKGRTLRIFERGHTGEEAMIRRLKLAGFTMVTERQDGGQIGFATANGKIAGHLDGVVTGGPDNIGGAPMRYPALWENKVLGEKSFSDLVKKGVRASKPVYFAQMQLYMAYLDLADNPGLFTAENGNTGEIYAELVAFDRAAAQEASDKGVRVVTSANPEELPRVTGRSTDFRCKFCDYFARCWLTVEPEPASERPTIMWSIGLPADASGADVANAFAGLPRA
jgi:hypothetical protein